MIPVVELPGKDDFGLKLGVRCYHGEEVSTVTGGGGQQLADDAVL
jgi:hypothetical protein